LSNKSIEFEFSQIDAELEIIKMLKVVNNQNGLDKIQLRAAASCIHSIYNGIEKVLFYSLKSHHVFLESSSRWHAELLEASLSHSFITETQYTTLKEYMGFRHFFRHNYGFMIDSDLIRPLLNNAEKLIKELKSQIVE
jgi:tRNA U34 5-carboxymethylaminomethyl modifying enzyme MnmG/GidA